MPPGAAARDEPPALTPAVGLSDGDGRGGGGGKPVLKEKIDDLERRTNSSNFHMHVRYYHLGK